jgi:predicted transcriptional regulator
VEFVCCDLMSEVAGAAVDVIVSNPPYVPLGDRAGLQREVRDHEPEAALFAGPTGLEIYERLVMDAQRVLRSGGWLVMELGYNSRDRVLAMLGPHWRDVRVVPDLAGIPRVLAARLNSEDNDSMKRRQILLDDETDRILDQLAQLHSGDRSRAIREALKMHRTMEGMLDELEALYADELKRQKERSEREFREGNVVTLEEMKRRYRL